jgi:hypothetical protein
LNHISSSFFSGYSGDRVFWSICPGWPQATILLISVYQEARIVGVNHWHQEALGFELRALCLSHSTSQFLWWVFQR